MKRRHFAFAAALAAALAAGCTTPLAGVERPASPPAPAAPAAGGGMADMPWADPSKLPPIGAGSTDIRITGAQLQPIRRPDNIGAFRLSCNFSHMSFDDPIVFPGKAGAAHLHSFFGNTGVNAFSDAASIAGAGTSTCSGGAANRSAYWVPSMIDTANGTPVTPSSIMVYYKTGYRGVTNDRIQAPPPGLRIIAGDTKATPANPYTTPSYIQPISWTCQDPVTNQNLSSDSPSVPSCAPGTQVNLALEFPQCWDGVNLDSADHKSHMAYGVYGSGCPSTHPVAIPVITFNVKWPVSSSTATWRLSSDMYSGGAGGFSAHGDWWNGWNMDVANTWVNNCLRAGLDCQMDLLGDGRRLT